MYLEIFKRILKCLYSLVNMTTLKKKRIILRTKWHVSASIVQYFDLLQILVKFFLFRFGSSAKVVHFLGQSKPWSYTFDPQTKQISGGVQDAPTHPAFLLDWWTLYASTVVPVLQEQYGDEPFVSGCLEVN